MNNSTAFNFEHSYSTLERLFIVEVEEILKLEIFISYFGNFLHFKNFRFLYKCILSTTGKENINFLDSDRLQVWTYLAKLKNFQENNQKLIRSFIEVLPIQKIHNSLLSKNKESTMNFKILDLDETLTILLSIAPISRAEKFKLLSKISKIKSVIESNSSSDYKDFIGQNNNNLELILKLKIYKNGSKETILALSKFREILWIEKRDDVRILNKWAKGIVDNGYGGNVLFRYILKFNIIF